MKRIFTFLTLLLVASASIAAVTAGDIAILQMNTDGSGTIIKFVTFVDIPASEVIYFTDNAYNGSGLSTNEGTVTWTSTGVTCGTIVAFLEGTMALSTSGDQIIAYTGSAATPTFITALHSDGAGFISTGTTSTNTSYLPAGLTSANALAIPEIDNMVYNGIITGTVAQLKTDIFNPANWLTDDFTPYDYTSTITLSDCPSSSTPIISVSPTSFMGLDYTVTLGPSGIDSAILSGSNLTGAVTGTVITNFEFSLDKTTWGAFPGAISGPVVNVTPMQVYVRLKAALAINTYSETLTLSSAGATSVDVTCSGEVTAAAVVCTPTLQSLPYNGIAGNTTLVHSTTSPPAIGPYSVCGTNFLLSYSTTPSTDGSTNEFGNSPTVSGLTGLSSEDFGGEASFETYPIDVSAVNAITIDALGLTVGSGFNTGGEYLSWWYSLDGGAQVNFFTNTLPTGSLAANEANVDVTGVNAIVVGFTFNMNGGNAGFEDMDVTVVEHVANSPTITVGSTSMTGFSVVAGAGASTTQGNTLEWANLTGSLISGNVVNFFEFSVDAGATWNDATLFNISIPPASGTQPVMSVLVRLVSGLSAGTYFDTIVLSSAGATTVDVYLDGEVTVAPIVLVDCADLFFSQYTESTSGSDKCYEIYNPTNAAIDLSNYSVALFSNGSTTPSGGLSALSGSIPAYGTWVVCNSSAGASFTALADAVGGSLNGSTFFNGDDDLALFNSTGDIIDYIGQIGVDPGSEYTGSGVSTANQNIQRIATVLKGDNNPNDTFVPSLEWTTVGVDVATGLGSHTNDCAPFIWTGSTSTDWSTAGNWNKNTVPALSDVMIIPTSPAGPNFPLASVNITVTDLTVQSGATLDVAPTFGLIVSGTVVNSGIITLQSSAAGTAWLDDFTNLATYTGNLTVQTFVTTGSGLGQRYFGSAVGASAVQGLDGTYTGYPLGQIIPLATCDPNQLDATSPYSNLFSWNENNAFPTGCVQEGWTAISAASTLTSGRAYSGWVSDGSIISVTGTPNSGNTSFVTSGVSASSVGIPNANGWHLLSNPFPSPLDVNSVFSSGFISPQTYDGGSGAYSGTFNPVLVTGNNLAVMQGFVAKSNAGSTFTASQADRFAGSEIWLRPEFTHMLEVNVLGNNMADKTYVYFDSEATDGFDNIADCEKRESDFGHPTLYTNLNGERLSLNGYAMDNMNRTVILGLLPGTNGSYTLNFDGIPSFPATSLIFLEDKLTGEFVNLREQTTHTFIANTADLVDRFEIHFISPVTLTTVDASCEGGDAELALDFGVHTINGNTIDWNYDLTANGSSLYSGSDVNGLMLVSSLNEGVYNLVLNQGSFFVNVPVQLNGAARVTAEFESPLPIEVGQTISLSNMSNGASNYLWTVEGQSFNTLDFTHTFDTPGTFNIQLEASNEDCEASKIQTIQVAAKTTGIKDAGDLAQANVYAQNATIVVDLSKLKLPTASSIEIYNLLGQSIYANQVGNTIVRIDTKNTSAYYFVTIRNKELQKVFKVLVK